MACAANRSDTSAQLLQIPANDLRPQVTCARPVCHGRYSYLADWRASYTLKLSGVCEGGHEQIDSDSACVVSDLLRCSAELLHHSIISCLVCQQSPTSRYDDHYRGLYGHSSSPQEAKPCEVRQVLLSRLEAETASHLYLLTADCCCAAMMPTWTPLLLLRTYSTWTGIQLAKSTSISMQHPCRAACSCRRLTRQLSTVS